jgi:hypothetical protein
LHHFVAVVVDDLDGDLAGVGFGERAADGLVERGPGVLVDVGLQRPLANAVELSVLDGLASAVSNHVVADASTGVEPLAEACRAATSAPSERGCERPVVRPDLGHATQQRRREMDEVASAEPGMAIGKPARGR